MRSRDTNSLGPRATGARPKKPSSGSFQSRALPLLLLAALSLYGGWFLSRAVHGRGGDHEDVVDDNGEHTSTGHALFAEEPRTVVTAVEELSPVHAVDSKPTKSQQQQQQQEQYGIGRAACNSTAGAGGSAGPPGSAPTLVFNGRQSLEMRTSEDAQLDTRELTLSAWVRLPERVPGAAPASIQTILASKASGCDPDAAHMGVALFVNAWNSDSGQLYLSWGNGKSGCEELATAEGAPTLP